MFDCPTRTKKLSTDGEKLRLTISYCSQLLLSDWLCPTVGSMCFTPLELNALQQIAPLSLLCVDRGLLQLRAAVRKACNLTTEPQRMLNLKKVTAIIRCPYSVWRSHYEGDLADRHHSPCSYQTNKVASYIFCIFESSHHNSLPSGISSWPG